MGLPQSETGSPAHQHRNFRILQHMARHTAQDQLPQAGMAIGTHGKHIGAKITHCAQKPGAHIPGLRLERH